MNTHQLHREADRLARREGITHREALSRIARRPRRNRVTVQLGAFANVEKPAAPYWWQKDL